MKFRDLFKIQPEQMLPDRERVRKQVFKRRSRKVSIITCSISTCAVLVVAAVCVLAVFSQPKEPEKILLTDSINIIEHIEPTQTGALGMSVQSDLKVTTTQNVTPSELKARMAITPEADYDVKRIGPQEYELRFEEDLAANTLYKVAAVYEENIVYRWAFQTESVFCITGATPQNETHVGVDTPVEITFSHADVSGFENAFQITPAVKGTFEHYGRTWAFVPSAPFEEATLYTVTIQKGITGPEGAALEEDLTFSFTTAPVNSYAYLLYQQNEAADTFLVDERPIAAICYENINFSKVNVKVYPFADAEAYRAAYGEYVRNGAVSGEIMALAEEPHAQFDATPIRAENYNGIYDHAAFINYPEALPQGYYFAEITVGSRKLYQLLQSTTLSVYTITVNGDYTVWVNDAISGEAAGGRVVSLEGFNEKETNDMGIVSFAGNKEAAQSRALLIENGAYPYVAFLDGNIADENIKQQNRYFSYLSTNSRLYRNGDTVGLFGVVLPRTANADLPDEVTLEWDFSDEEFQVEVEKNGSFTAELSLGNTALTSGNICLMMGETCLYETYIYIADYELPTYYVTLTTDRLVYEAGETGIVSALVTYMDETPAPQIPLSIGNGIITGTTDENGRLTGTFIAEGYEDEYYTDTAAPQVHYISGNVENGTDVYYGGEVAYMVVTEPYLLEGSYEDGTLSVQADTVSYAKADQLDAEHLYEEESVELLRGNGATLELTGELHRITYKKTPNGTTYDPIHKRVVYTWDYEEQDELVRTIELKAEEGSGELKIPESADEDAFYYVL
ncbi:MAG: Ig-like domain-containing protein [Clostridia bacterium]|nr:Ig-like domain-containing protein [Clostridia bacterium]